MNYAWEKFHVAIGSLTGARSQRARLVGAYAYSLIHLKPDDLPKEIREQFRQFQHDMTRVPAKGDEGSIQATVDAMDDEEVQRMVDAIVSMHDTVTRHQEPF